MKTIKSLAYVILALALTISCSSSDNSSDNSTTNCDQYIAATAAAQQTYTSSNTSQNCNAYKTALQNQIANCGDTNGSLQAIVNSLGNCTVQTTNCDQLIAATAAAQQAYVNSNTSQNCNAYKTALQNQIATCGDTNGSLQAIVNNLGNCTVQTVTGTLTMNTGSVPHVFDLITVTTSGTTRHVRGQKSSSTLYEVNFDVVVGQTGANNIINFEFRGLSQTYFPNIPAPLGNNWTSAITVNSATSLVGTFRGELANEGQTSAQEILNGIVNINF
jgi:hypothetical protein